MMARAIISANHAFRIICPVHSSKPLLATCFLMTAHVYIFLLKEIRVGSLRSTCPIYAAACKGHRATALCRARSRDAKSPSPRRQGAASCRSSWPGVLCLATNLRESATKKWEGGGPYPTSGILILPKPDSSPVRDATVLFSRKSMCPKTLPSWKRSTRPKRMDDPRNRATNRTAGEAGWTKIC